MTQDFFKDSKLLGIWTQISRVLGLIRDNLCGRIFGTSIEFGAFTLAFRIPDLFRRLLDEGVLTAVFTPQLVDKLEKEGQEKSLQFASSIFSMLLIILSLFCVIGIIVFATISQFAPINEEWKYILKYSIILIPYLVFIGLIALLGSILNALKHFFSPAFSPILFNLIWIAGLIIAWNCYETTNQRITLVCFFLTFSGVLQVGLLLYVLRKYNWKIHFSFNQNSFALKNIFVKFLPAIFCLAVFQLNVLIDGVLAIFLVDSKHAAAALYYSDRIQQLPFGIVAISIATATYPMLALLHSQNKKDELKQNLTTALRGVWFLTIPSCIGILFLNTSLVQQFYSFKDQESTSSTAITLICFSIGLVFTCTIPLLTRVFYARGELKTPAKVGLGIVLLNIFLCIVFLQLTNLGGAALALATSVSSFVYAGILFYLVHKKLNLIDLTQIKSSCLKLLIPSISLIAWLVFLQHEICHQTIYNLTQYIWWFASHSSLFYLLFSVSSSIIIYMATAYFIKSSEFREIFLKKKESH